MTTLSLAPTSSFSKYLDVEKGISITTKLVTTESRITCTVILLHKPGKGFKVPIIGT